ncbi:hypothetical protein M9H77_27736 [Catharanthus roseus]|uniref:Uncharacterized protein n=1 Tax=Catharanthus roseus TaxID=4058 RepID=A0ACC0AHN4_CATRO|nr:hypothetical protein M9H77_27736 [Catharanthus roseus]
MSGLACRPDEGRDSLTNLITNLAVSRINLTPFPCQAYSPMTLEKPWLIWLQQLANRIIKVDAAQLLITATFLKYGRPREALNCIWVWRNDQLHNPNNSVPSTPYLIRDIICRANHILTNVYLLDDFDGISPDYPDATQGSFLSVRGLHCTWLVPSRRASSDGVDVSDSEEWIHLKRGVGCGGCGPMVYVDTASLIWEEWLFDNRVLVWCLVGIDYEMLELGSDDLIMLWDLDFVHFLAAPRTPHVGLSISGVKATKEKCFLIILHELFFVKLLHHGRLEAQYAAEVVGMEFFVRVYPEGHVFSFCLLLLEPFLRYFYPCLEMIIKRFLNLEF